MTASSSTGKRTGGWRLEVAPVSDKAPCVSRTAALVSSSLQNQPHHSHKKVSGWSGCREGYGEVDGITHRCNVGRLKTPPRMQWGKVELLFDTSRW